MINIDNRFVKVSLHDLQSPVHGKKVITDSWWSYKDGHVLGFKLYGPKSKEIPTPQCNKDEATAKKLTSSLYKDYDVIFVPVAYWPYSEGS